MTSGLTPSGRNGGAKCPFGSCDGSGLVVDEATNTAYDCRCRDQLIARAKARNLSAVIPRRYRDVAFERPPVTEMDRDVVRTTRDFTDSIGEQLESGRGLWFMGPVGTGKTTLAMLVSKRASEAGHSVAIYSLPKLLARIRRTFESEPGGESYLSFFERLTSVDLLHIDDLGAEKRSDWVLEQLYALVNERYEAQRSVIVTTNLPHEELEAQIGARTVSRLTQICDEVPLFGDDRRYGKVA